MSIVHRHFTIPCGMFVIAGFALLSSCQFAPSGQDADDPTIRVMTFNILQGGGNASNVGFYDDDFGGSRIDDIAQVILDSRAQIVGIQEDASTDALLEALGTGWHRVGNIYSNFEMTELPSVGSVAVARVHISDDQSLVIANAHWRPSPYGPFDVQEYLRENGAPNKAEAFSALILEGARKADGGRGYDETLSAVRPHVEGGEIVLLTGDFNEPSHLDWTEHAARNGIDRWESNPTGIPLRFEIAWEGSPLLHELGFSDAYRTVHSDEAHRPGITWTPRYPDGTKGRRLFGDQVLDRIDMIYFAGPAVRVEHAAVIGEDSAWCEIVHEGRWPSDHRAVMASFRIRQE